MKERPILFSAPMVRAILEGRKSQTRRVCKGQRELSNIHDFRLDSSPYGVPGDRLWVRETWRSYPMAGNDGAAAPIFRATHPQADTITGWKPSIHMPRAASRILLEVTDVRVERLQDLTERDAVAEGVDPAPGLRGEDDLAVHTVMSKHDMRHHDQPGLMPAPVARFVLLWDSINGKQPGVTNWNANPWVWVVSFQRLEAP